MAAVKKVPAVQYYIVEVGEYDLHGPYASVAEAQEEADVCGYEQFEVYIKQGTYKIEYTMTLKEIK